MRRGRDSNPGASFPANCLAGSCLRPLGHLSWNYGNLRSGCGVLHRYRPEIVAECKSREAHTQLKTGRVSQVGGAHPSRSKGLLKNSSQTSR